MKKLRFFSILILIIGVFVFSLAMAKRDKDKVYKPTGYIIVSTETVTRPGGEPTLVNVWTRAVKKTGEWKEIIMGYTGNGNTQLQEVSGGADGVLKSHGSHNHFLSAWTPNPEEYYSTRFLKTSPEFVREEMVMGYKTYVLRSGPHADGSYTDRYFSPKIGSPQIKTVDYRPDEGMRVIESVSITIGEPPDDLVTAPQKPIIFDGLKDKIKQLEEAGRHDLAEGWRQQLIEGERIHNKK